MRFTKIAVKKDGVELSWSKIDEHGATITTNMVSPEKPAPELPQALQAFLPFAMDLIGAPDDWSKDAIVTSLSISDEKGTPARGLIVTAIRPIKKASGRPLVLNTPHMRQASGDTPATQTGILSDEIIELIAAAERAAESFVKGDRAQLDVFPADQSDQTKSDDQVGAKREQKKRKRTDPKAGTPEEVVNPGKSTPVDDETLRQLLLKAERDVPVDALAILTSTEHDAAQRWAEAKIDVMSGKSRHIDDLVEPEFLGKIATPPLGGDGWTDNKPRKLDDGAVAEIKATIEQ